MKGWKTAAKEPIYRHPLFTIEKRRLERDGERREIVALDSADWVHVVPLLPDGRVVLVRQWRYATESFHLELPGGIVDDPGEDRAAAERELAEETGYRAGRWQLLGEVEPNPAILDNRLTVWLATELERLAPEERPPGDEHEELEVVEVPLERLPELVAAGEIRHALMLASFYLLGLAGKPASPPPPGA
jgi:8-oxo-dGTP pyrophosphatase MutT (NUDIX family)